LLIDNPFSVPTLIFPSNFFSSPFQKFYNKISFHLANLSPAKKFEDLTSQQEIISKKILKRVDFNLEIAANCYLAYCTQMQPLTFIKGQSSPSTSSLQFYGTFKDFETI